MGRPFLEAPVVEWLYGRHSVEEALKAGRRKITRVLTAASDQPKGPRAPGPSRFQEIERLAKQAGVPVEQVHPQRLDQLSKANHHHQGVVAEASAFPYSSLQDVADLTKAAGIEALVLILDSIQDPQNFGTLLRTADAVGVTAVVMLDRRQVDVTPSVSNASAGAVEHLEVCLANNLARALDTLKEAGLWVYALQAEPEASLYTATDLRGPIGLVVGSEGQGVGRLVRERCDGAIELPMRGQVESLNAAVAGSIALYEALRQRGLKSSS
jgi:23S rRNA (guanosine2251-2'-O)-methyltransferase